MKAIKVYIHCNLESASLKADFESLLCAISSVVGVLVARDCSMVLIGRGLGLRPKRRRCFGNKVSRGPKFNF